MIESYKLERNQSHRLARVKIKYKPGSPQEIKGKDIFRSIVSLKTCEQGPLQRYGIIGNLMGLTYAETFGIALGQIRQTNTDIDYNVIDRNLKRGFYSLKESGMANSP